MRKIIVVLAIIVIAVVSYRTYQNHRPVNVVGAHHNKYTAEILVDNLPGSESSSIQWWLDNQSAIRARYGIPPAAEGPLFITIYAFGDGYKEEGKKDRLCFDDVAAPKNCIDKNILMSVNRTRDGDTTFNFEHSSWLMTKGGKLSETD